MTAVNRFNSISADPSKANRAESDERDTSDGLFLIALDITELDLVGGGNSKRVAPPEAA